MTCTYCQQPVSPSPFFFASSIVYRRIQGWERKATNPSRRSGSDVLLREPLDEWCCEECMTRLRAGLSAAQDSLL